MKSFTCLVLYNRKENQWKLADFGISAMATSKMARSTKQGRGSLGYCAPELLTQPPTYSNKVDIWALGCILYELVTGDKLFTSDLHTLKYFAGEVGSDLSISVASLPRFLDDHITQNMVQDLLSRERNRRLKASGIRRILLTYCWFSDLPSFRDLANVQSYPSYFEWTELLKTDPTEQNFFRQLAEIYSSKGEGDAATAIRCEADLKILLNPVYIHQKLNLNEPSGLVPGVQELNIGSAQFIIDVSFLMYSVR